MGGYDVTGLTWSFSDEGRAIVAESKGDGYFALEELDRFEGLWQAVFIGDGWKRLVKSGQLRVCLDACDADRPQTGEGLLR
jgi:hypothetical protein